MKILNYLLVFVFVFSACTKTEISKKYITYKAFIIDSIQGGTLLNLVLFTDESGKIDSAYRPYWQMAGMSSGTCTSQNNWQITLPLKSGQNANIGIWEWSGATGRTEVQIYCNNSLIGQKEYISGQGPWTWLTCAMP